MEPPPHRGLLDDTGLHVEDHGGPGPPVVLLHGWPLSARVWDGQVAALTQADYRPIAYDRRGFGRSERPIGDCDFDLLADDLESVLDRLGLVDVSLVGFAMGAGEVVRYVTRHGEGRLRSVVLAATVTPYLLRTFDNACGPLTAEDIAQLRYDLVHHRDKFLDDFTREIFSVDGQPSVSERQRQDALAVCHQADQEAALGCLEAFCTTDFRLDLERVSVPTLVVHGESDAAVPFPKSGLKTHEAIAHSQLVALPDAPHAVNLSHPRQFDDALLTFLEALA